MTVALAFELLRDGVTRGWWDKEVVGELSGAVDEGGIAPQLEAS